MPITEIYIRDAEMASVLAAIKKKFSEVRVAETMAYNVGREFGTSLRLLGLSGGLISGGFIASIASITTALGTFARKSVLLRSTIGELNLSLEEFDRLKQMGMAQGLSEQEATADLTKFAKAVIDLRTGADSATRKRLEERGTFGSGTIVSRQLQAQLEKDGDRPYNSMLRILRQMQIGADSTQEQRLASQIWRESFGLGSPAWNQAFEYFNEFGGDVVAPTEKEAVDFLVAQINLERELKNLWTRVGVTLLPSLNTLSKKFAEWVEPENLKAFSARMKAWAEGIRDQDWGEIRRTIMRSLGEMEAGASSFARDAAAVVRHVTNIIAMVSRWPKGGQWNVGTPVPYQAPKFADAAAEAQGFGVDQKPPAPPQPEQPAPQPQRFSGAEQPQQQPTSRFTPDPDFLAGREEGLGSAGGRIEDRRGLSPSPERRRRLVEPMPMLDRPVARRWRRRNDLDQQPRRSGVPRIDPAGQQQRRGIRSPFSQNVEQRLLRERLIDRGKDMGIELRRLVDVLRDIRQGEGGGSSDGGVSEINRSPPMDTDAGGGGGPPDQPPDREEKNGGSIRSLLGSPAAPTKPMPDVNVEFGDLSIGGQPPEAEDQEANRVKYLNPGNVDALRDQVEAAADPVAKLGFKNLRSDARFDPRTGRALPSPITPIAEKGIYGSADLPMSRGARGSIRFDPGNPSAASTVLHEAGHIGRRVVDLEAGANEPNILKSYGFSRDVKPNDEHLQRSLDLENIETSGLVGDREKASERMETGYFLKDQGQGRLAELKRHNVMYSDYAQKMLSADRASVDRVNRDTGWKARAAGQLDLNVNVRGGRGMKVKSEVTDGDLMSDDRMKMQRHITR